MNASRTDASPSSRFEDLFGPLSGPTATGLEIHFPALTSPVLVVVSEQPKRLSAGLSVSCEVGRLDVQARSVGDWLIRRQGSLDGAFFSLELDESLWVRVELPLAADREAVADAAQLVAEAAYDMRYALRRAGALEGDEEL